MIEECTRAEQLGVADAYMVLEQWGHFNLGGHAWDVQHEAVPPVIYLEAIYDEAAGKPQAHPLDMYAGAHALGKRIPHKVGQPSLDRWYRRESQQHQVASEHD